MADRLIQLNSDVADHYFLKSRALLQLNQPAQAVKPLIKAVGIYSPGSYVRLATNEIAGVVKRGVNTTTPRVAVVINRSGMPTTDYIIRDTSRADYRIATSVPHQDVKVKLHLERLLPLTKAPPSDRLW